MATLLTDLSQFQQHQHQKNLQVKQQNQEQVINTLSHSSPPSSSTSPSHEFSFTISLHSSSSSTQQISNDRTKSHQPNNNPFAEDLSPADEIFFHGHLLPLHLLTHLPVKELGGYPKPGKGDDHQSSSKINNIGGSESFSYYHHDKETNLLPSRNNKTKSFSSIFGWRKGFEGKEKNKRKSSFDLSQVLKKYARIVKPFLFFKGRKNEDVHCHHMHAHSFSDSSSWRRNREEEPRGRRGEFFSAPASMRTSPSNSGLLLPLPPPSNTDSTMEELQAAIQAAIAHCKNSSIATEEKIKFQS